jgi:aspartate/methionine/tyrosine aminotransferase
MQAASARVAQRFAPFGTTIFTEMTALAVQHGAINLSQGFPDFDGPQFIQHAAAEAMRQGKNQYARMAGLPELTTAIARQWHRQTALELDPQTQVTVTSGCTEALAAAMLGLLNPGDEIVMFEPYYDSYPACAAMAGATVRTVTLHPPSASAPAGMNVAAEDQAFTFDESELRQAFTPRTRAILLNTPHNPTGKVFTCAELSLVAELCIAHDVIAITDEVYEHLTYEPLLPHTRLATLPGMAQRTLTLSSLGKTFSLTGWKIGWSIGSPELSRALRAAHQFLNFCTATPLQAAAAVALEQGEAAVAELACALAGKRNLLGASLERIGFRVFKPAGTYFILADYTSLGAWRNDIEFCRWLVEKIGVAAIPPSVFYSDRARAGNLARFAFCKRDETLAAAIDRLEKLAR